MTDWLTPQQVAAELQVHRRTVGRWIDCGDLPALRVGSVVRVSRQTLAAWQRAHTNAGDGGFPSPADAPASAGRFGTPSSVRSLSRDEFPADYQPLFGDNGELLAASPAAGRTRSARTKRNAV